MVAGVGADCAFSIESILITFKDKFLLLAVSCKDVVTWYSEKGQRFE
jgi:hypothetical protein